MCTGLLPPGANPIAVKILIIIIIIIVSCSCTSDTPSDDALEFINIKVEEGSGVTVKVEENPEPISCPTIKAQPDELPPLELVEVKGEPYFEVMFEDQKADADIEGNFEDKKADVDRDM